MKRFILLFTAFVVFFTFLVIEEAKAKIELDSKSLKDIETMERRHYRTPVGDADTTEYRLNRLETTIFGQTFEDMDTKERMRRLRIGSQKMFMTGAAMPIKMNSKKINAGDDQIQVVERDNVGIIDGLLKMYAPEMFEKIKDKNDRLMRNEVDW